MRKTVLLAVAVLVSCAPRRVEPEKKPVAKPTPKLEAAPAVAVPAPAPRVGPPVPEPERKFVTRGLGGGGGMFSPSSSPHDPDLMFVNSDMGCISRSEDGGKSWQVLDQRVAMRDQGRSELLFLEDILCLSEVLASGSGTPLVVDVLCRDTLLDGIVLCDL